ncbi:methyltransferase-like protein 27 [Diadema antillarum]|uniref:methyltransferase-like protein 27 n=1 Tax=Diadema antillarum TaxID=105358 RepID=UPI003A841B97
MNNNHSSFDAMGNGADTDSAMVAEKTLKRIHGFKNEQVERAYDDIADQYDLMVKSMAYNGPIQTLMAILRTVPDRNAAILDVGCGTGLVGDVIYKSGYRNIYGLDVSAESLRVAEEKGTYRQAFQADICGNRPIDVPDDHFDVVSSTGCFLPGHLTGDCLPEMVRLTKSGGHIIITVREKEFEQEIGGMNLKSAIIKQTDMGAIKRKCHDRGFYIREKGEDIQGLTLVYYVV